MRNVLFKPPVLATVFVALVAASLFIQRSSDSELRLALLGGLSEPFELFVTMPFEPEAFHIAELQGLGRIVGIEGDRVHLKAVSREELHSLSWIQWIDAIVPAPETAQ